MGFSGLVVLVKWLSGCGFGAIWWFCGRISCSSSFGLRFLRGWWLCLRLVWAGCNVGWGLDLWFCVLLICWLLSSWLLWYSFTCGWVSWDCGLGCAGVGCVWCFGGGFLGLRVWFVFAGVEFCLRFDLWMLGVVGARFGGFNNLVGFVIW